MKDDKSRSTLHGNLCIVCEGESTENNFCKDLISYLEMHNIEGVNSRDVTILPPPRDDNANSIPNARRVKKQRKTLNSDNSTSFSLKIQPGQPPLKWINTGELALNTYSEVWVMFDNDNHPAREDAFNKAKEIRKLGKNLNIVYSSWSFEYYLLQHFEYLFHSFTDTEHRHGDEKLNCCTNNPLPDACNGEITDTNRSACITGYARKRGYWINSKTPNTFSFVRNIWMGICNAYAVKWEKLDDVWRNHSGSPLPIGELNPYLDTYRIVLRLMNFKELSLFTPFVTNENIELTLSSSSLKIQNNTGRTYIIRPESIIKCRYQYDKDDKLCYLEVERAIRTMINSGEEYYMSLPSMALDTFYIATFDNEKIFFKTPRNSGAYTREYLELYHYSDLN